VRKKREKREKVYPSVTAACKARVEVGAALPGFMAEMCRFGGLQKLSPLFHEDDQDDQDDQLINLLSSRRADEMDGPS
jgi:hypothetical protein